MGQPEKFDILELGANDATLAGDILQALKTTELYPALTYRIIEPLASLRQKQLEHLRDHHHTNVEVISELDSAPPCQGVFLSNELFDALPVELLRFHKQRWQYLHVGSNQGNFTELWQELPTNSPLQQFADSLGDDYPENYTTEFRPLIDSLAKKISLCFERGLMIAIDYGFPRSHYYHPDRVEGTLQCYSKHQKDEKVLSQPGLKDITAHVDFTQLAQVFTANGFHLADFSPQHRYLTEHGRTWLLELEKTFSPSSLPLIQQFQTLTHPSMMGKQFQVLEMGKNIDFTIPPTTRDPAEVLEL